MKKETCQNIKKEFVWKINQEQDKTIDKVYEPSRRNTLEYR